MQRKGNIFVLLVGMQTGAATLENSMEFSQKVKNRITLYPAIAPLGIYPKDAKILSKGYMHPNVYSSIIYDSQIIETFHVH